MQTPKPTQSRGKSQKSAIGLFIFLVLLSVALIGPAGRQYFSRTITARNTALEAPVLELAPEVPVAASSAPMASSPASVPASTPVPALPSTSPSKVPATGQSGLGVSFADTLTGLSAAELAEELDDIVALRLTWIRLDMDWSVVQRRDSHTFDWSRLDRVVAAASQRHLNILSILVYTPAWARGEDCTNRCPPEDPAAFAHFASEAVKRYSGKGVHAWEIWNEPNMRASWLPGADPAGYTVLLKAAYLAIKDADPSATVMTGGLGPIDTKNGNIAPRDYLAALYREGAEPYFDAVAFHPYSFPVTPTYPAPWNAWHQMDATSPSLRSIMIANGDGAKRIWVTEYGAPTGGPGEASDGYDPREHTDHVTEDLQQKMLLEAISQMRTYDWAGPLFWYSYKDLGVSEASTENFYGLLREDGSAKPAYDALLKGL